MFGLQIEAFNMAKMAIFVYPVILQELEPQNPQNHWVVERRCLFTRPTILGIHSLNFQVIYFMFWKRPSAHSLEWPGLFKAAISGLVSMDAIIMEVENGSLQY